MAAALPVLAERLATLFGCRHAVLFGRARSGLAVLLDILRDREGGMSSNPAPIEVLVPSNICPAVPLAVQAAGAEVRLVTVSRLTGLPSDAVMAERIQAGPARGVVMVAHLYGFVADYPETRRVARAKGWVILENDSVAAKARWPGAPLQASPLFGDVALVSFGSAKTIEAGGGGAVLTDDSEWARELAVRAAALPVWDAAAEARDQWFMAMHRQLRQGPPGGPALVGLIEGLRSAESDGLRLGFPEALAEPLAAALDRLPATVASRRAVAVLWAERLAGLGPMLETPPVAQPVPWRLIRRLEQGRDAVVAALRAAGLDAGTNYPPLNAAYPGWFGAACGEEAEAWGREVLNLWVTPETTPECMDRAVALMAAVGRRDDIGGDSR
jgi:dTDP-4-amino-4,6-dideoxygalactose transaminase